MKAVTEWRKFVYHRHDVYVNQKYGDNDIHPYSVHLGFAEAQGEKFLHLISGIVINKGNHRSNSVKSKTIVRLALIGHDLEEDARMTYNDVWETVNTDTLGNALAAKMVADIIHAVTDEKGKNRAGRKNDKYYRELSENKLAIFVKLADISANTLYGKLTGSTMYDKYKKEFPKFKELCYVPEYKEFFDYVESL